MSLACVLYLISSLDLVDPRFSGEEKRSKVLQCLHDLQLYANDHWLDHLLALVDSQTDSVHDGSLMLCLRQSLDRLTERHNKLVIPRACNAQDNYNPLPNSLPLAIEKGWSHLRFSPATQNLLNGVSDYRSKAMEGDQIVNSSCMYTSILLLLILCYADYTVFSQFL